MAQIRQVAKSVYPITVEETDGTRDETGVVTNDIFRVKKLDGTNVLAVDNTGVITTPGWSSNGGSIPAAYVIVPDGLGGAVANACDAGLSNIVSSNPVTVFQGAINALALQNGGKGGRVYFKGQHIWSAPVTVYPGIGLTGDGPLGNKSVQLTGSSIRSTYNGDSLVVTGINAGNTYFPYLAGFQLWGANALTSQNLVRFDNSGGSILFDAFMDKVLLFNAGQHAIYAPQAPKLWLTGCYMESSINGDGLNIPASNTGPISLDNCYIFGNLNGINNVGGGDLFCTNNRFWQNATTAFVTTGSLGQLALLGNSFKNNAPGGAPSTPQVRIQNMNQSGTAGGLAVVGNVFRDDRGAGNNVRFHMRLAESNAILGAVTGNMFGVTNSGSAILVTKQSGNRLTIHSNAGYNDVFGTLATPFTSVNHIGVEGDVAAGVAAPTASTAYRCVGTPLFVSSTGGTGVSITITDSGGATVVSGLATYTGQLPVGYSINFGGFSVAPTVYVGVV